MADVGVSLDFFHQRRRGHAVQIQYRQRPAAGFVPAQAHAGDIDVVLAHQGPNIAHDAGPVFIIHQE